jgi:periplasmic divalent cation tolerance protein
MLDMRLVACANIFPIESIYWWKGKKETANEFALIFKTTAARVRRLVRELKKAHSYDVPCIVTWPIPEGNGDYLKWISSETR